MTKTAAEMVAEARARIENLPPDQVEKEMAAGTALIDLRDAPELEANGRIPGAVHVPRGCSNSGPIPPAPTTRSRSTQPSGSSCTAPAVVVRRLPPPHSRTWATRTSPTSMAE